MIDRKALRISGMILLAIVAATLWRLSLYPDWRLPVAGSHNTVSGLFLFAGPASQMIALVTVPFIQWLTSPKEIRPAWRRWSGKWIVSWSVFIALLQAFVLAHSLNLVSLPAQSSGRFFLVVMGIMFMIVGNATPKAPSRPQQSSFELDPWQQNRLLRFAGKLLTGMGVAFAVGGILLPPKLWEPVFLCLMLAALAAGIWYGIKLRHEPRDKVVGDAR